MVDRFENLFTAIPANGGELTMADTLQQLLRERADHDTLAMKYGDRSWTWREHIAEASAQAAALMAIADRDRPLHVGCWGTPPTC